MSVIILCILVLVITCSFKQTYLSNNIESKIVSVNMRFIVVDEHENRLKDSKVVILGNDGNILNTIFTNTNGEADIKISVPEDPRYSDNVANGLSPRGTVTAIAFKNGFRQTVLFEVGVSEDSILQYIYMKPLIAGTRNEPITQLGQTHHLEIYSLVKKYANLVDEKVND